MIHPALHYYNFWREVVRFYAERNVEEMREASKSRPGQSYTPIDRWSLSAYEWARSSAQAPLNYRLQLGVSGLSDAHLDQRGLFEPLVEQFEPVITVNCYYYRSRHPLMSIWPNGDFMFHTNPEYYMNVMTDATFLRTNYAVGKRVWLIPRTPDTLRTRWQRLDERDYNTHHLYLPKTVFLSNVLYRLNYTDQWIFTAPGIMPLEQDAQQRLTEGYGQAERRYARARRKVEHNVDAAKRTKLALYIPKRGRMTGLEAVSEFSQHMRVYPASKPEEAENNGNSVVTSTVHR